MTTNFCKEESAFKKITDNFTFNKKDKSGLINIFLLSTAGLNQLNLFILRLACNSKIVKDEIKRTEIQIKNDN